MKLFFEEPENIICLKKKESLLVFCVFQIFDDQPECIPNMLNVCEYDILFKFPQNLFQGAELAGE